MRRLALATESWWDIGVRFGATLPKGRLYRIATTIVVSVGDGAAQFEAQRKLVNEQIIDDRLVVMR